VRSLELLAGFCYTQFADTYQEVNGLLRGDRTPKVPLASIAEAVAGSVSGQAKADLAPEDRGQPLLQEGTGDPFDEDATIIVGPGRNPAHG
jgi:hypothetical protein